MNTTQNEQNSASDRPLGYWLRTVDGLITREFLAAFEGEGVTRRHWMLLNVLSGEVEIPGLAERIARKGKRLRGLAERGWVEEGDDGTWVLTDDGRAAKERLGGIVDGLRERVAGAVSPEDYATMTASLEAIARELGGDEVDSGPRGGFGPRFAFGRGRGRGFAFGPGFGPDSGFRPGFGPAFRPGFGPEGHGRGCDGDASAHLHDHSPHAHKGHRRGRPHGHHDHDGRGERRSERAYERGFDAGFARGRSGSEA
ncbi:MarR family winged helix-turn-helix transcriptional regulator [Microbacterium sp.]|uniref:MarR family winged helix-turn-helix transcriptional regulator n=1 Tax=Microbacterium sp. TaxID=51671 RepID=UPI003F6F9A32